MEGDLVLLGRAGFVLFVIGLLIGFALPRLRNSRMGLSAHLTAVQTGPALIVIAFFWPYLNVPQLWQLALILSVVLSSYLLVAGILLASIYGASNALPIAGRGFIATKAKERVVLIIVKGSSVWMAVSYVTITWFALATSNSQ